MTIETEEDLLKLKAIGRVVEATLKQMMQSTEPGMITWKLDRIGKKLLGSYGTSSTTKMTYDFPGYTCISINEEAAHGISDSRGIQPGDIANIDVSAASTTFGVEGSKKYS